MLFVSLVVKGIVAQDLIIFCHESHGFILFDTKRLFGLDSFLNPQNAGGGFCEFTIQRDG